jgi:hypothetical protein
VSQSRRDETGVAKIRLDRHERDDGRLRCAVRSGSLKPRESSVDDHSVKTCPDCAGEVKEAARLCHYCGFRFLTSDERAGFLRYSVGRGWSEAEARSRAECRHEVEEFRYVQEQSDKAEAIGREVAQNQAEVERLVARGVPQSVAFSRVVVGPFPDDIEARNRLIDLGVPPDEAEELVKTSPCRYPLPPRSPVRKPRREGGGFFAIFGDPFGDG